MLESGCLNPKQCEKAEDFTDLCSNCIADYEAWSIQAEAETAEEIQAWLDANEPEGDEAFESPPDFDPTHFDQWTLRPVKAFRLRERDPVEEILHGYVTGQMAQGEALRNYDAPCDTCGSKVSRGDADAMFYRNGNPFQCRNCVDAENALAETRAGYLYGRPEPEPPLCTRCGRVTSDDDPDVRYKHGEVIACSSCIPCREFFTDRPKPKHREVTLSTARRYKRRFGGKIIGGSANEEMRLYRVIGVTHSLVAVISPIWR